RIVFYIAVSNTDCHLRNHGFILEEAGWALSPAFDVNAVAPAAGLHLNITEDDNRLEYALAMDVIGYFQLGKAEAEKIYREVMTAVGRWQEKADEAGIGK